MRFLTSCFSVVTVFLAFHTPSLAEEGMWTLNGFPTDAVEKAYGFRATPEWLEKVQRSSVRLARGCSASFVSPHGLVQTNHHCAIQCIEGLSRSGRDYMNEGFSAATLNDETQCPNVEANQLIAIGDVTTRVKQALEGKEQADFEAAKKAIEAQIARECANGDDAIRCDVVELYKGGIYNLYKYKRYQDIRLVFAPEESVAFFGGDPDNFEFPRYDYDVTYMRVYEAGKPLDTSSNYFPYAKTDAKAGDLVFTAGHPGSTRRLSTVAELEYARDVSLPRDLFRSSELRGLLTEFSAQGPEKARIATGQLFGVENSLKGSKGRFLALLDPAFMAAKVKAEAEFRAAVEADPAAKDAYAGAWDGIKETLSYLRTRPELNAIPQAFSSRLFSFASELVRYHVEKAKPDEIRLTEFTDANFPAVRQSLLSKAPIYPELEKLTLTFSLTKLRETLGPDHPFVRKVLGKKSPAQLATETIDGTKLIDPEFRNRVLKGEVAEADLAADPMIAVARVTDADRRAVRKELEDKVAAPLTKFSSQIAAARFKIYGTSVYPDATFTLRVSYGSVKGYEQSGQQIAPVTTISGLFNRYTGADPFDLPKRWLDARERLDANQPMNFVTTNDIIGGNSGSPVINANAEVVGLIFDGNRQSLGGDYGYEGRTNRAVAVNVGALTSALKSVYGADRIADELSK